MTIFSKFGPAAAASAFRPAEAEPEWRVMVAELRAFDLSNRAEWSLRYLIIFIGMVASFALSQDLWIVGLLSGYFFFDMLYLFLLLRTPAAPSRPQYYKLIAVDCTGHLFYSLAAAYLFSLGAIPTIVISVAATAAFALYSLARHQRVSIGMAFDWLLLLMLSLYIGLSPLMEMPNWTERVILLISTFGVASYFVLAQTAMLRTRKQLAAAKSQAMQAQKLQAIGQLTAGVAHDFNNILTVINGNLELAELTDNVVEQRERMSEARGAAIRAASMTNQLLAYSRKARHNDRAVEVLPFMQRFGDVLARVLPATIVLERSHDDRLKALYCDPTQLETAMLNLVINARDALDGKGKISLSCGFAPPSAVRRLGLDAAAPDFYGAVCVSDNGPGIPAGISDDVFEPFFTTKPVGKGSGLGLSMAQGFCEQSGGGLLLDSVEGEGAQFMLVLPTAPRN